MPENPASYRVVRTKSYLFNKAMPRLTSAFHTCTGSMLKLRKARIPSVPKEPPGCTALTSTTASDKQRATKKGEHYVHPFFIIRRSL
ncbi:hypothetical protein FMK14_04455 [Klebsiella pneumoniae]|nr:hypothetical protein [Klebsiella pneumoniae]